MAFASMYHKLKVKFQFLIDKRDRNIAIAYCKNMEEVIRETDYYYTKINPTRLSINERTEKGLLENISLTYGETPWETCINIIKELEIDKNDNFYDLGCGSGRMVFLVNRQFGIKSTGIDLIEDFIKISSHVSKTLELKKINFLNADFLKEDLSEGSIFYIASTCFDTALMEQIAEKLKEIKQGSRVVIITNEINCPHLRLYRSKRLNFSWSRDTAYFYEKV